MQRSGMVIILLSNLLFWGGLIGLLVRARRKRAAEAKQADSSTPKTIEQQLAACAQTLALVYDEKERSLTMDSPHTSWRASLLHKGEGDMLLELSAHPQQEHEPGKPTLGKPPHHARALPLHESVPFCEPIILRAETRYDHIGKLLKINRELQTNDPRFDELIYIESDAPDRLIKLTLNDPELRDHVIQCIERGFSSVHLYEHDALIKLRQHPPQRSMCEAAQLQLSINTMDAMARRLPYVSMLNNAKAPTSYNGLLWALLLIGSILSMFTFAFLRYYHIPLTNNLANTALTGAVLGWFALFPVVILVLRGRSSSFRDVIMWMGLLAFVLPLWAFLLTREANALLDPKPPQEIAAIVESTWRSGEENSQCNVRFKPETRYVPFSVKVSCNEEARLIPRMPITLLIGEGALNHPWFKGWQPR